MDDMRVGNGSTDENWGYRRLGSRDPRMVRLLALIAIERDVPVRMLRAHSRCRAEVAEARRLAMYLSHVALGRSVMTIARLFGRHWSTVARACAAIEDQRDAQEFDVTVSRLEAMLDVANENDVLVIPERFHAAG